MVTADIQRPICAYLAKLAVKKSGQSLCGEKSFATPGHLAICFANFSLHPLAFARMKVIASPNELKNGAQKVCIAIGMFDGVHLGHQQVIRQAISDAQQSEGVSLV